MIDDVKELLSAGSKIREAMEATDVVKKRMRTRLKDYNSMLHVLLQSGSPENFKSELQRLHDIYTEIEALHVKHTAGPDDPRWVRFAKKVNRGTQHQSIEEDLDAIDGEALQLFTAIAAKSSIDNSKAIRQILRDLKLEATRVSAGSKLLVAGGVFGAVFAVLGALTLARRDGEAPVDVLQAAELILRDLGPDGARISGRTQLFVVGLFVTLLVAFGVVMTAHRNAVSSMIRGALPPTLPEKAAVPAGALALPDSYMERPCVREAADGLTNPETALAPYTVVGMGGGGKTVLASAVVRKPSVREHFRGGIFWVSVGREAKRSLLSLLQALVREMGAAPTDAPHGVPHALDNLEQVKQHLATVASMGTSPRLVVLDDVWEREVVDAFLPLKLKVLVTSRDHSVVGLPGGRLELGDMTEEEALKLLQKTSLAVGRPGVDARAQMTKVVARCGRLPLGLAIAGSMPIVKGKGLTAGAWAKLVKELENVAKKMRARGEQSTSLKLVLETSFDALSARKQEEFLKMAVMAAGAVAPIEMLLNLWEIQDVEGTREEADGLVSKCLLQGVGDDGYRVHDLVLEAMKMNVKADTEMVKKATALQAQYLSRLDVVQGYCDPRHGAGENGLFFLDALWRSAEELSGDPRLEADSYQASLKELESCEETEDVANSYSRIGSLFNVQGKCAEAQPLLDRCQAIREKALGPEHPTLATALNDLATLLMNQGKFAEAQPLFERCQAIQEKALGPEHPLLATTLGNWGNLLEVQGKHDEAEPLYMRAIVVGEKALGSDHPKVAEWLNNRALLLEAQGKDDEARSLFNRAFAIGEKALGPDHPDVAKVLGNQALLLSKQGKCAEAESLFERSQAIMENVLGREHPILANTLKNRALLLVNQGKYDAAEPLSIRALAIGEKALGPDHLNLVALLGCRARLLHSQGKQAEVGPLYERCQAIQEKVLGPEHPDLAVTLNDRAFLLMNQAKYAEAEQLYERCQAILDKALGPEHPTLTTTLNNWAEVLIAQGKFDQAEPLYIRAIAIGDKTLGPDHPFVAVWRTVLATYQIVKKSPELSEAMLLVQRALSVPEKKGGLLQRALSVSEKKGETPPGTSATQDVLEFFGKMVQVPDMEEDDGSSQGETMQGEG